MKHLLLTVYLIINCSASVFGQLYYALSKKLSAREYAGLAYRFEAIVKVMSDDSFPAARLFLRSDLKAGKEAWNWLKEYARPKEWSLITLEGTIDKDAENFVFGLYCQYPGPFFFDNLKLMVKGLDGKWKTIDEDGFEQGLNGWSDGYINGTERGKNRYFQKTIDPSVFSKGKSSLKIEAIDLPGSNKKTGAYAKVNGINLYYEIYGSGRPLLMLHGNGGSINAAGTHLDFFAQRYKVIAVDSRAQGRSIYNRNDLTYELMASDINELLNQLKIDSTYIWGQSDGAILAIILALNHPNKVKKAVAFAANTVPDTIGIEAPIIPYVRRMAFDSPNKKDNQLSGLMYRHPNIQPSKLGAIKADMLIMSGDRDFIPLAHTIDIFKHIPNSNLCIIPGATHNGAWEKPELFQTIVTDFFEKPFKKPSTISWFK